MQKRASEHQRFVTAGRHAIRHLLTPLASGMTSVVMVATAATLAACVTVVEDDASGATVAAGPDGAEAVAATSGSGEGLPGDAPAVLEAHGDMINSIGVSPDGTTLITGSYKKEVVVWDMATRTQRLSFDGHGNWIVRGYAFHPSGDRVASADEAGQVLLWDPASGSLLTEPVNYPGAAVSLAYSPDGTTLVTTFNNGEVRVLDGSTLSPLTEEPLTGHKRPKASVHSSQFAPDGSMFVTAATDSSLQRWDPVALAPLGEPIGSLSDLRHIAFADSKTLVVSSLHGPVIWDIQAATRLLEVDLPANGPPKAMAVSPDGTLIAEGHVGSRIHFVRTRDGAYLGERDGEADVMDLVFSPTGGVLLSSHRDGSVRFWTF